MARKWTKEQREAQAERMRARAKAAIRPMEIKQSPIVEVREGLPHSVRYLQADGQIVELEHIENIYIRKDT